LLDGGVHSAALLRTVLPFDFDSGFGSRSGSGLGGDSINSEEGKGVKVTALKGLVRDYLAPSDNLHAIVSFPGIDTNHSSSSPNPPSGTGTGIGVFTLSFTDSSPEVGKKRNGFEVFGTEGWMEVRSVVVPVSSGSSDSSDSSVPVGSGGSGVGSAPTPGSAPGIGSSTTTEKTEKTEKKQPKIRSFIHSFSPNLKPQSTPQPTPTPGTAPGTAPTSSAPTQTTQTTQPTKPFSEPTPSAPKEKKVIRITLHKNPPPSPPSPPPKSDQAGDDEPSPTGKEIIKVYEEDSDRGVIEEIKAFLEAVVDVEGGGGGGVEDGGREGRGEGRGKGGKVLGDPRDALWDVAFIEAGLKSEGRVVDLGELMSGLD